MTVKEIFTDFAKAFEKKIDKNYSIRLRLEIKDMPGEIWQVDVNNGKVNIYNEEKISPEITIMILNKEVLDKIYNNELSALSAILQTPSKNDGMMGALICEAEEPVGKDFLIRLNVFRGFFSKDFPAKIILDNRYCVKHNGDINTIGLKAFGSFGQIYVSVKKGETLYYPPLGVHIEFNIYIIKGKGKIIIGDEENEIKEREYYYMNLLKQVEIKSADDETLEALIILQLPNNLSQNK
jgi:hypothetical protein